VDWKDLLQESSDEVQDEHLQHSNLETEEFNVSFSNEVHSSHFALLPNEMPDCANPFDRNQVLVEDVSDDESACEYFMEESNSSTECSTSEEDMNDTSVIEQVEETTSTKAQTNEPKKKPVHTEDVCTQNVQGMWRRVRDDDGKVLYSVEPDSIKRNAIIAKMKDKDIGAMCVQETWDEGDVFDEEINEYRIFRHNCTPGESGRDHLFKGVALILSPTFYKAWREAGCQPPTVSKGEFEGRLIGMYLKFQNYNKHGKPIKGKGAFLNLFLASAYHPWREEEHSKFNQVLDDFIGNVKDSAEILIGADINAKFGTRYRD
jgi:hypothetical protein